MNKRTASSAASSDPGSYHYFARETAEHVGKSGAFKTAVTVVLLWAATGPIFHFSDTWQLVINTGTTIVTFLMVFLIQYAQNRDNKTIQLKLDELIKAVKTAQNEMIDLDRMTDEDLASLEARYKRLSQHASSARTRRDQPTPAN